MQITVVLLGFLIVGAIAFHLFSEVSIRCGYFFFFITLEPRVERYKSLCAPDAIQPRVYVLRAYTSL